ncbi:MAG TPA: RNA polymerase factor sigma-54 [Candidatus Acidoferrales bacterium]|nr:RNA polymerase factor sigma-54 [Candidatus Acidoferrales bacterium]
MLKFGQTQRLSQELRLQPQQILYYDLLQQPIFALQQRLRTELDENPVLELEEVDELVEEPELELKDADEKPENPIDEPEFSDTDLDEFRNDGTEVRLKRRNEDDEEYEFAPPAVETMYDHLIQQLSLLDLSDKEKRLGEEIIGNIDDDGYLREDLQKIVDDTNLSFQLDLTIQDAEKVLTEIQTLDPIGVGARNLRECLMVQLKARRDIDPQERAIALKIIEEGFEDYSNHRYDQLSKKLGITNGELKVADAVIRKLNPKPGEGFSLPLETTVVVPDFVVAENEQGELIITLNERDMPQVRISPRYLDMMKRARGNKTDAQTKDFLKRKLESAKWFVNALQQRRQTMLSVMRALIETQREFFTEGPDRIRPLIYRDIADRTGFDISTISRVVSAKYVQTDFGVFKLRELFSEGLKTIDGDEVATREIKNKIKAMIESEEKPLNDEKITEVLNQQGYKVARRTVTKYREQLKIPPARMRREA